MKNVAFVLGLITALALSAWSDDTKKPGKCSPGYTWFDNHGECIPPGGIFEIDGVSVDDISKILDDHREELEQIKGYAGSGIDQHGIFVDVLPEHNPLPANFHGLPLHTHPYSEAIGADL